MKTCSRCGLVKSILEFRKWKHSKDGFTASCVLCVRTMDRERYERHRDSRKAYQKKIYAERAQVRERHKRAAASWQKANPGKVSLSNKNRYDRDRERILNRNKAYRKINSARFAVLASRRRARQLAADGSHTVEERLKILASNEGLCSYCNIRPATTVDHVIPLVRGGRNSKENLAPACGSCNSEKHPKLVEEWRKAG